MFTDEIEMVEFDEMDEVAEVPADEQILLNLKANILDIQDHINSMGGLIELLKVDEMLAMDPPRLGFLTAYKDMLLAYTKLLRGD